MSAANRNRVRLGFTLLIPSSCGKLLQWNAEVPSLSRFPVRKGDAMNDPAIPCYGPLFILWFSILHQISHLSQTFGMSRLSAPPCGDQNRAAELIAFA